MLQQQDTELTIKEVAHKIEMTASPLFKRTSRPERDDVIMACTVVVNKELAGKGQVVSAISTCLITHQKDRGI